MKKSNIQYILLISLLVIFFLLKISQISYRFSDDNIYFYMGKMVMQGAIPYKDFFFASPPLQIYLLGFFSLFIGKNYLLLKLVPIIATSISAAIIFLIVKRQFTDEHDFWKPIIAASLFLFSFLILTTSDFCTGVHITTMFVAAMIYFIYSKKPFIAGLMASLALLTRLYSPFPVFGAFVYILLFRRKQSVKFILGLSLFFIVAILMNIVSQGAFLYDIFFSKLGLISSGALSKLDILKFLFKWDWFIVLFSLAFVFVKEKKMFMLPIFVLIPTLIFYLIYSDLYYMYFALLAPFLAIFASHALINIKEEMKNRYINIGIVLILVFISIFNSTFYLRDQAKVGKIEFMDDLVDYVKENSNPEDTLYGSYAITPILALLAERDISHNIVDTNNKNFAAGIFDRKERTEIIKDDVKFIISKVNIADGNIINVEYFVDTDFIRNCTKVKIYPINDELNYDALVMWDCKQKI